MPPALFSYEVSLPRAANPTKRWHRDASQVLANARRRIPKGFRLKAQGCEDRATLGKTTAEQQPQRGCGSARGDVAQPRWGCKTSRSPPRVARSSQPWAGGHNPVGIGATGGFLCGRSFRQHYGSIPLRVCANKLPAATPPTPSSSHSTPASTAPPRPSPHSAIRACLSPSPPLADSPARAARHRARRR